MVSNLSEKQTYIGSTPIFPSLLFCILCFVALFTSCGLEPVGAEELILGNIIGESIIGDKIGKLDMPLVDPYARDNKPEDIIRHFVGQVAADEPADILVVIGATPDQYDEIMGSYWSPSESFYYKHYVDEMYYGEIGNPNGIVFVPWGYKMFGYKFLPSRYDLAGKIIHLRKTTRYEVGDDMVSRPVGLEWKFTQY